MRKWRSFFIGLFACLMMISCSSQNTSSSQPDYEKTKEMTLDVLHTNEGRKALLEIMASDEFKKEMIINHQELEKIFTQSLADQKQQKNWEKVLTQPKVMEEFSKLTEDQQKKLLKALMKDPEYQKSMMDILKDPAFSQTLLQVLKSQEYRKETLKLMQELMKTPRFQQMKQGQQQGQQQGGQQQNQQQGGSGDSTSM